MYGASMTSDAGTVRKVIVADGKPPSETTSRQRLFFIDNLRWTMIILVISMHAADTYSPLGNWYYTDRRPVSTPELLFFAAWQMYLQSFFMGLLFFVAGVFVPPSLDRKGPSRFLRDRAFRLGLPVLFYMFVLGPLIEYYCSHSWNSTLPTSFANEWIKHIRNGEFLQENGPLWFCLALLIFSLAYASIRTISPERAIDEREGPPPSGAKTVGFALAMAASTFLVRVVLPPGFSVLNMHLGDFAQYIFLFAMGVTASGRGWLQKLSPASGRWWLGIVVPGGFVGWLLTLHYGGMFSGNGHALSAGWHWQNACFSLWESFTCVAVCYGLLTFYRERLNVQSPIARFFSENAFSVYVFHPPIVILLARAMHPLTWPPLIMFLLLTASATLTSFFLSAVLFRRIPLLKEIL
jgi:glucans biosynthesis protein C